jgi:hypothetical protein
VDRSARGIAEGNVGGAGGVDFVVVVRLVRLA